jgi:catalase
MADTSHFGRLAGTAIVVLGVAGAFLYLGGWFNSEALTPGRFADGFERADGIYSGFRLNHAKGVCVSGSFESNGRGTRLSKAVVFKAGRVPTMGRFSFAGGNPYVADGPELVRGFGLLFKLPDGEEWRTAMINTAVFGVHTPQAFYDRLFASQPDPKTGKPDPEKMARFRSAPPFPVKRHITEETIPMKQTWHGHSAFRIEAGEAKILIDPFLSDNPSRDNGWSGYLTGKNSTQGGDR